MSSEPPVVLVVDDDRSVCAAVKRLLTSAGHHVQTYTSTRNVFAQGRPEAPCCLILDLQLQDTDGLHFQDSMEEVGIHVPIIFLTGHADVRSSVRAMKSGAADFLTKPFDAEKLLEAVDRALDQDARYLDKRRLLDLLGEKYGLLTPREREVFAAVTSGMLNKQVAEALNMALKTVKVHRSRVMKKMQCKAIADLVRMADVLDVRFDPTGGAVAVV